MNRSRCKDSRWDLTVPKEFESAGYVDVGGEGKTTLVQRSGDATKEGTSVGVYRMEEEAGQEV